jgi:TusA-related sulfurtransferase
MVAQKVDHHMDLRGEVCPYPSVEIRVFLKKMAIGEVLELVTYYDPVRQTIPTLVVY